MQPQLPRVTIALVTIALSALVQGCVRRYRPPTADEPHAVLKLRRAHEQHAGESLRETLLIDGHRAFSVVSPAKQSATPHTDAVLIHPEAAAFRVESTFFHHETRAVQESYQHQVSYLATESYSCGTYQSPRTCTRTVTRYRPETRYRTVWRKVEVVDGKCARLIRFVPEVSRTYLLQYTYQGSDACHLACFEQTPAPGREFTQKACRAPPKE